MITLTLPGAIPSLRRLCSPVYSSRDDLYGVVVAAPMGLAVYSPTEGDSHVHDIDDDWDLDLTNATGRDHARRWLNILRGSTRDAAPHYVLQVSTLDGLPYHSGWPDLPRQLLAHLNPGDPRLLPDGSRWVDAEALRLVVLYVSGVRS